MDIDASFDEFQEEAVSAIKADFERKTTGRYLLVIPTGGGKTRTAVKSLCALYDAGILSEEQDEVIWVAHRQELIQQAKKTLETFVTETDTTAPIHKIHVLMISRLSATISENRNIKLVVIDEAHHAAANSYQIIFQDNGFGVLGLTATPSRHDKKALPFEKESYSIGFPDLVERNIIISPTIKTIAGEKLLITDIGDNSEDLEQLNTSSRNGKIIKNIIDNKEAYKKIVIYVGTTKHAKDLYTLLNGNQQIKSHYDSISFITGGGNSRRQSREDYINDEKLFNSSIIVNVQVLTEGYDDPKINTVIFATITKSSQLYMQAIGRAIRKDIDNPGKESFIVEIEDELPNIKYRIDNRWIFSEISDALEPDILDYTFNSADDFRRKLEECFASHNVVKNSFDIPAYDDNNRYSILLFNRYLAPEKYSYFPVLITNENRHLMCTIFNSISENCDDYVVKNLSFQHVFGFLTEGAQYSFSEDEKRYVFDAMKNAYNLITKDNPDEFIRKGFPWVTFVSLRYVKTLPESILSFIEGMDNYDDVFETIQSKSYADSVVLIKFPLPLSLYHGVFVSLDDFKIIQQIIDALKAFDENSEDQFTYVDSLMGNMIFPVEIKYTFSLILIVRENLDYFLIID